VIDQSREGECRKASPTFFIYENYLKQLSKEDKMVDPYKPADNAVIAQLIKGTIPKGPGFHEDEGETTFWNQGTGPDYSEFLIWAAHRQLKEALASGATGDKKDNRDIVLFPSNPKFPLTISLAEQGWTQWQSIIPLYTREEAEAKGVGYKKHRYAVHFWVNPERTKLVMGKLKMENKPIPNVDDCKKLK